MEVVLLLAGLSLLAIGGLFLFDEGRNRRDAIAIPAELVGYSTRSGASGGAFFHVVARYPGLDGQMRYVESSVGSSSPLGSVGDRLTVLVHPADPGKAAIKSSLTVVLGTVIALVGVGCCVLFCSIFRVTPFSLGAAALVVGTCAWKLRGFVRAFLQNKAVAAQAWNDWRNAVAGVSSFTEAARGEIRWAEPAALESAVRKLEKTNRFATPFLLIAGVALVLLGFFLHQRTAGFLERAVRGSGVVVDLAASHSGDGVTLAPVVEFESGGGTYRFRDSVSSNPASYGRGDRVTVLYDPARPADARIDHGWWNQGIPLLIGACGLAFCALGLWRMSRRQPQRIQPALEES